MNSLTIASDGLLEQGQNISLCIATRGLIVTAIIPYLPPTGGGGARYRPYRVRTGRYPIQEIWEQKEKELILAHLHREDGEILEIIIQSVTGRFIK